MKKQLFSLSVAAQVLCFLLFSSVLTFAQISIDPPTRTFAKDGGGGSILTSGTGTWTASTTAPWITITPRTTADAGVSCIYIVGSNLSADTRQGEVTVGGQVHTVTQTGYSASLSPSSASAALDGSSGSVSITTQAGVSWTAVSNAAWITVTPASGVSNGSVAYTVEAYGGVVSRTGSLTIAGKTFSITQTGADVNLSPKSVEKAYSSDIVQIQVSALAGTSWTVTTPNSWVSIIDGGNGFGDSNITLAISTNPSFAERIATVSIGTATFMIYQAGTPNPVLDLIPREATADPIGAYGNIAVVSTPDAPWSAKSMDSWLVVSEGATGAGNGNIKYVVSANPGLTPRTGRVAVYPPVFVPTVDLTKQLWTYIPEEGHTSDLSGWGRNLSGTIDAFDGTFSRTLTGLDFSREDDNSMTFAIQFKVDTIDTINRLFQIQRDASDTSDVTAVYINSENQLVLHVGGQTITTDFNVSAGTWQQMILTATDDHQVHFYAGTVGEEALQEIGSYSLSQAPFPADAVTETNRIQFGYSTQPNTGYLNHAGLKDLRIYGRALSGDEVNALHVSAINGQPLGTSPVKNSPTATVKMNLRGQFLRIENDGSISFSPSSNLSLNLKNLTTSKKIVNSLNLSGSLVKTVGGTVNFTRSSSYSSDYIYWNFEIFYSDGTYSILPTRKAYTSEYSASATYVETNPHPERPVSHIDLKANKDGYRYINSYSSSFLVERKAPLSNWDRTTDRFGLSERALKSSGTGKIIWGNHDSEFSSTSATYNFWLRMDSMAATKKIFTRGSLSLSITSDGSLQLAGPVSATLPTSIETGKWHMVTLAGSYSPATAILYVDGKEIGNVPGSSYHYGSGSNTDMLIGGFVGAIDEVSFYDGVLTPAEIRTVYEREAPQVVYHTVTQGVVDPDVSPQLINLPASGGSTSVALTLANNVNWTASTPTPWISITSPEQGAGSTTVAFDVIANPTVYERQGTVEVAGKAVTIVQAGLNVTVQHDELIFTTDGGSGWIEVSPEGGGQWQAVSDVSWLSIAIGESGAGQGSVFVVADPYTNTSGSRTGSITVAGWKVFVTQRGYELSITPQVAEIGSNAGAGEFGVAAPLSAVWEAIATQPWITIMGGTSGVGNGTIRYSIAVNGTGAVRTGRILVAGTEYTITQNTNLLLTTTTDGNGSVSGGGSFETNATATLTPTPASGYAFSHWTGDGVGSANPLNLHMDSSKTVTAHFIPSGAATSFANAAVQNVLDNPNAHDLFTDDQMHGLAFGDPVFKRDPLTGKMKLTLNLKKSANLRQWDPVNLPAVDVNVQNGGIQIQITPQGNAAYYRLQTTSP